MNSPTPYLTDRERREHDRDNGATVGILQQIENAVAAMKATPAIRLSQWHHIQFQHDADSVAEVNAIAAGIGAVPQWNRARTHYMAARDYGPNVAYVVVYITPEYMEAHDAHMRAFRAPQDTREDELAVTGAAA